MVFVNSIDEILSEPRTNSLGRTVEVVDNILQNQDLLSDLYDCYFSENEWVRLRVSNAFKRICKEKPDWIVPFLDRLIGEVSGIDQASVRWTLATLFEWLWKDMTPSQIEKATIIMKWNLKNSTDWIVLKNTMQTLSLWSSDDLDLHSWLHPKLKILCQDSRKSVSGTAKKMLDKYFS